MRIYKINGSYSKVRNGCVLDDMTDLYFNTREKAKRALGEEAAKILMAYCQTETGAEALEYIKSISKKTKTVVLDGIGDYIAKVNGDGDVYCIINHVDHHAMEIKSIEVED